MENNMDLQAAISKVVTQFTKLNPTLIDCVNKRAKKMETFKLEIYEYMNKYIPEEYHDRCYEEQRMRTHLHCYP